MSDALSPNTQAILLLIAPLIASRAKRSEDLLSTGEYKKLAVRLRELERQPADLLMHDAEPILDECHGEIDKGRLQRLLGRGFLLSQSLEHWHARAIWVVSRADREYPKRARRTGSGRVVAGERRSRPRFMTTSRSGAG